LRLRIRRSAVRISLGALASLQFHSRSFAPIDTDSHRSEPILTDPVASGLQAGQGGSPRLAWSERWCREAVTARRASDGQKDAHEPLGRRCLGRLAPRLQPAVSCAGARPANAVSSRWASSRCTARAPARPRRPQQRDPRRRQEACGDRGRRRLHYRTCAVDPVACVVCLLDRTRASGRQPSDRSLPCKRAAALTRLMQKRRAGHLIPPCEAWHWPSSVGTLAS
jgi:hypothetical protein